MKYLNIDLTANDFPPKEFPEFYPTSEDNTINKVLSELNRHLELSLNEPLPDGATVGQALDCLREDINKHPDEYLSVKLWVETYSIHNDNDKKIF